MSSAPYVLEAKAGSYNDQQDEQYNNQNKRIPAIEASSIAAITAAAGAETSETAITKHRHSPHLCYIPNKLCEGTAICMGIFIAMQNFPNITLLV